MHGVATRLVVGHHICAGTGAIPATSAPGLGSPVRLGWWSGTASVGQTLQHGVQRCNLVEHSVRPCNLLYCTEAD